MRAPSGPTCSPCSGRAPPELHADTKGGPTLTKTASLAARFEAFLDPQKDRLNAAQFCCRLHLRACQPFHALGHIFHRHIHLVYLIHNSLYIGSAQEQRENKNEQRYTGLVRNSILSCSMYVPVLFIRRQVGSSGSSRTCRTVRRYLYI